MPRIVIRGMNKLDVKKIGDELLTKIENIINRPKDSFTLELLNSTAISEGEEISQVYVEVSWKNRSNQICKDVSEVISELIKKIGYKKVYVYFKDLDLEKEFVY